MFRASVAEMPELAAILQPRDVDTAATLLIAGLTHSSMFPGTYLLQLG